MREELFNTFVKATESTSGIATDSKSEPIQTIDTKKESKQERKERAVREREEKVKVEKEKVDARIGRSKQELNKEEDEQAFMCARLLFSCNPLYCGAHFRLLLHFFRSLLTDAIRDPQVRQHTSLECY